MWNVTASGRPHGGIGVVVGDAALRSEPTTPSAARRAHLPKGMSKSNTKSRKARAAGSRSSFKSRKTRAVRLGNMPLVGVDEESGQDEQEERFQQPEQPKGSKSALSEPYSASSHNARKQLFASEQENQNSNCERPSELWDVSQTQRYFVAPVGDGQFATTPRSQKTSLARRSAEIGGIVLFPTECKTASHSKNQDYFPMTSKKTEQRRPRRLLNDNQEPTPSAHALTFMAEDPEDLSVSWKDTIEAYALVEESSHDCCSVEEGHEAHVKAVVQKTYTLLHKHPDITAVDVQLHLLEHGAGLLFTEKCDTHYTCGSDAGANTDDVRLLYAPGDFIDVVCAISEARGENIELRSPLDPTYGEAASEYMLRENEALALVSAATCPAASLF